jgi:germination protein M
MKRRDTSRLTGLLGASLVAGLLLASAGVAACGGSPAPTTTVTVTAAPSAAQSAPATPSPPVTSKPRVSLSLYFLRSAKLGTATRRFTSTQLVATTALKALLKGPTAAERAAGLSSDIPPATRLKSLTVNAGIATADLSAAFASPATSTAAARRVAEVVYTLTQFPTIKRVALTIDGDRLREIAGEGSDAPALAIDSPLRRSAPWTSFEPPIFVESPGVGALIASPFTLTGTASVFEGSFAARLIDSSGRRIVIATVQASRGAPGRGRYRKVVSYSTSAVRGFLEVYSQSMENGSRQNVVRIPVTFSQ